MICLPHTTSTNTALKSLLANEPRLPHGEVLYTHCQTAGRGQRGNTWEAEPGCNVTMSMLLRPSVGASQQFYVSEAVALGVADVVAGLLGEDGCVKVKWPNDIYVGDKKIAGILIENSLQGSRIDYSIAGIGLNVNQEVFHSDAPNPVSIRQLTGRDHDVDHVVELVGAAILRHLQPDGSVEGRFDRLHRNYISRLWRGEGFHPYLTPDGHSFRGEIVDVSPTGMLTLRDTEGRMSTYAFKEIAAIL